MSDDVVEPRNRSKLWRRLRDRIAQAPAGHYSFRSEVAVRLTAAIWETRTYGVRASNREIRNVVLDVTDAVLDDVATEEERLLLKFTTWLAWRGSDAKPDVRGAEFERELRANLSMEPSPTGMNGTSGEWKVARREDAPPMVRFVAGVEVFEDEK